MASKSKKIKLIFFIYWFLLVYIIAALVWWYIALMRQNKQMTFFKIQDLHKGDANYFKQYEKIKDEQRRKTAQYIGEGSIFFLLIGAAAIFLYRAVNRQLKISQQQQNFMIAITHELKTPIAITKLNLETMQKRKLDDIQQQRLLNNTLQEANRMNALCNNMLFSSQIEAGGYRIINEEINMSDLVQTCLNDFLIRYVQRKIDGNIEKDLFITGDAQLLQMAVNNLIDNAIKYSPKENAVTIKLLKKESMVMLEVIDEGAGIDETEKKKVFEKFYRIGNEATRRAKGTGLGLYLAHKIVSVHKGKILIKNNQPGGSVFVVELRQAI